MLNLNNKKIVLLGNAESVFNKKRQIDERFDIVCRINAGLPTGVEDYIGSRTDILFLSLTLPENEIKKFNSQYVIVCSPKVFLFYCVDERYSLDDWNRLYRELKARPSTGIMAFDYILQLGEFKTLTLIGFDFWKSPNWYTATIHTAKHNPEAEQKYILQKIKEYNGKIIWEK